MRGVYMTIAGFNFTRLLAEKKAQMRSEISINTNIAVVSAEEIDFVMGSNKQKGIKVTFDYRNAYTPDLGTLIIGGEILYLSDQKKHDELMKGWGKNKKFPEDITAEFFDMISVKASVEAIHLATTVGLPPPVPLPRFRAGQAGQQEHQQPHGKGKK